MHRGRKKAHTLSINPNNFGEINGDLPVNTLILIKIVSFPIFRLKLNCYWRKTVRYKLRITYVRIFVFHWHVTWTRNRHQVGISFTHTVFNQFLSIVTNVECETFSIFLENCIKNTYDPDVIRTRNLLIWSQTRYRCATESACLIPPITTWHASLSSERLSYADNSM